jgi:hypothetical protein
MDDDTGDRSTARLASRRAGTVTVYNAAERNAAAAGTPAGA